MSAEWARIGYTTYLRHDFFTFPPADHWISVDVQVPNPIGNSGCSPFTPSTAYFIYDPGTGHGLGATLSGGNWFWTTGFTTGPDLPALAPLTTFTVELHKYPASGGSNLDWYVNGVLVISETNVSDTGAAQFWLNLRTTQCCCEAAYYTNVKVGSSHGAGDLFNDDFSSGTIDLTRWYVRNYFVNFPLNIAEVVPVPLSYGCPTITASPPRGNPGDTFTLTGSGFTPGSSLQFYWEGLYDETNTATTDGSGNFTVTVTVPPGVGSSFTPFGLATFTLGILDENQVFSCTAFDVCGGQVADGINAGWDNPTDQNPTNIPNPVVGSGGVSSGVNRILDYVFHDGAHWILWQDPSVLTNRGTFPPPANHTLNATRISADGSTVTDYPIDTGYRWEFSTGSFDDPGLFDTTSCGGTLLQAPVWTQNFYFTGWDKPIFDAHFASDGTNLWVGVVTAETVVYPWQDNKSAHGHDPGSAAQFVPLSVLTSGFTVFPTSAGAGYNRAHTETDGPLNLYRNTAFPVSDMGESDSGHWSPPIVVIFAFTGSGFTRIGDIPALYCPGLSETDAYSFGRSALIGTPPYNQPGPRGSLFSRLSMAASEVAPGVCHVVWSEGGDWGRVGDGDPCYASPYGGTRYVWDGGAPNRDYRVNYTTWSPTAKLTDNNLWHTHIDRTNWFFYNTDGVGDGPFDTGYTIPGPGLANFAFLLNFEVKNDFDGTPRLFCVLPNVLQGVFNFNTGFGCPPVFTDPTYGPWQDWNVYWSDTLHVYDISGGTPTLLQSLDLSLFADEAETDAAWLPGAVHSWIPPLANNVVPLPYPVDDGSGHVLGDDAGLGFLSSGNLMQRGFGISRIYDDKKLGVPVYAVHVPTIRDFISEVINFSTGQIGCVPTINSGLGTPGRPTTSMRGFYRIPADMSATFDFMDGDRVLGFTIIGGLLPGGGSMDAYLPQSGDFFNDGSNIWIPSVEPYGGSLAQGQDGFWFDLICNNTWKFTTDAFTPSRFTVPNIRPAYAACPGFHWDAAGDTLSMVGAYETGSVLFLVQQFYICRGCRTCQCGKGVHLSHRF